ncbi:MAG TPA: hypothetical protein VHH32_01620 [Gemmatimonadales bacterium]|nr:hypothetical protein [Gemmatimonadales bacterium]
MREKSVEDRQQELANLLRAAGHAHHQAFIAVNGDDPEWPEWYARYLAAPLAHILGTPLRTAQLAATLRDLDDEMRRVAPSAEWTLYYAVRLLEIAGRWKAGVAPISGQPSQ